MSPHPEQHHYLPDLRPRHDLRDWMLRADLARFSLRQLEGLALQAFLEQTAGFAVPADERLRELAIWVESIATRTSQPQGWRCLQRVYMHAHRQAPENTWIGHSQARSSLNCVARRLSDRVRMDILVEGQQAVEQALFVHPRKPQLLSVMGELCVCMGQVEVALSWFERAVHRDANLPHAALERARILREMQRWDDAVNAYDAVPVSQLVGPSAWRAVRLWEQRGWCHLQRGADGLAQADFLRALDHYERDAALAEQSMGVDLVWAAARFYPAVLRRRVHAVAHEIAWDWATEMLAEG